MRSRRRWRSTNSVWPEERLPGSGATSCRRSSGPMRGARSRAGPMTSMPELSRRLEYRTIWISDLHLGTRGCKAEFLLDFLRRTEADTLYLVGDIIDGWRLKKSWYWPQAHNDVIQKV